MQFRLVLWAALISMPAFGAAQIQIGGARLTGLAGAGLALPYDAGQTVHNPGVFARNRQKVKFHGPYISDFSRGLSLGEMQDIYSSVQGGALETNNFGTLARRFAEGRKEIGLEGSVGVTLGGVYVGYRGEAAAETLPNQTLKDWAAQSGDVATLSTTYSGAGMDGYGYAYDSVEFGYGVPIQQESGTWNVGVKLKNVRAFYTHFLANAATIQTGGDGTPGPEMDGNGVLRKSGVGLDTGFLYTPRTAKNMHFGGVVENLIKPSVGFEQAAPQTGTISDFNPFNTAVSLGVAYVPDARFMAAADYIDIGDTAHRAGLRMGAQYKVRKHLAFSAGVNTRDTWIVGADVWGVYVTFSGRNKLWLGQSFKF